jgi:hypothetical protein
LGVKVLPVTVLLLAGLGLVPLAGSGVETAPEAASVTLRGKVVSLSTALSEAKLGIKVDREPIARQVVLLGDDGTITPLLSDEASRALFVDERLQGRPTEIHGRRYAGVPYLQVVTFQVEEDGQLQTPEYYCNICTISVRYPQDCPCCQGPMELRMKPSRR